MDQNAELVRLEEMIDKLLAKYSQLKADYQTLEELLQEKETECGELKNTLANLSEEQTTVSNRVSSLLDRISQWEIEQNSSEQNEGQVSESSQGTLLFQGEPEGRFG